MEVILRGTPEEIKKVFRIKDKEHISPTFTIGGNDIAKDYLKSR